MVFHEIYGCYYKAVSKILETAVKGELSQKEMRRIIEENTFAESFLNIIPAIENEEWQLINRELKTPIKHIPNMPVTALQKRWLKSISLDPRIKLFNVNFDFLDDVEPLFTTEDYVVFDKYNDGDDYDSEEYINNFHRVMGAIHNMKNISIIYENRKGEDISLTCTPYQMEYSQKDDKFRVLVTGCKNAETINVGRIKKCEVAEIELLGEVTPKKKKTNYFVMELINQRNALERVMLHFAHFKKEAEKIADSVYRVKVYYRKDDETELVIRVLSFGPFVKVTEPYGFVELIKERLIMQKSCGLK